MCRYALQIYKQHYVCFDCRKTFKQYPAEDLILRDGHWESYRQAYLSRLTEKSKRFREQNPKLIALLDSYFERKYPCPQCRKDMLNIGRDFRAPALHKTKEWEIIRSLYTAGKAFHSCGCNGPGFITRKTGEQREYLLQMKALYEVRLSQRNGQSRKELAEYLAYWQQRLQQVQAQLTVLGVPTVAVRKKTFRN